MHSTDKVLNTYALNAVVCKGHRQGGGHLKLVTLPCYLCEGLLNYISSALHVLTCSTLAWGEPFYLLQHVHIYIVLLSSLNVRVCKYFGLVSGSEPPVCPVCCFTCEPRCASAVLQLYSTFHSNLRDWELKAWGTFFNNEGILCLQYSTWLTHAVWAAMHFKGRQTLIIFQVRSWAKY